MMKYKGFATTLFWPT